MAVFRVERNTGYTVMSNHHLRNKELSLKAKGLLSQMLSLPEDWDYCKAGEVNTACPACSVNMDSCTGKEATPEEPAEQEQPQNGMGGLLIRRSGFPGI